MITRTLVLGGAFLAAGCSGSAATGNKVMSPPAADKSSAETILREHGVESPVIALQDRGDYWTATVSTQTSAASNNKGEATLSPPAVYQVFKDGRVVNARDNKPLKKK